MEENLDHYWRYLNYAIRQIEQADFHKGLHKDRATKTSGRAKNHIPRESIRDIDHVWELLDQSICDPLTVLNFCLARIKAKNKITEKVQETQPEKADEWFLDMEHAIDAIIRCGGRNQLLEYIACNPNTLYDITSRLPYSLLEKAYELQRHDRSKLEQIKMLIQTGRVVQLESPTNF